MVDFESHLPYEMRYKHVEAIGDTLYWVTQEDFYGEDLRVFQDALTKYTSFKKAYVIVRDDSCYDYGRDRSSGKGCLILSQRTKLKQQLRKNAKAIELLRKELQRAYHDREEEALYDDINYIIAYADESLNEVFENLTDEDVQLIAYYFSEKGF